MIVWPTYQSRRNMNSSASCFISLFTMNCLHLEKATPMLALTFICCYFIFVCGYFRTAIDKKLIFEQHAGVVYK